MKQCEITKMEVDEKLLTKTSDGHNVLFDLYKLVSMFSGKGIMTLSEISRWNFLLRQHDLAVERTVRTIKKKAIYKNISAAYILEQFMKFEENVSQELFKKTRNTLSLEEHLKVMRELDRTFFETEFESIPIPQINGNSDGDPIKQKYVKDLHITRLLNIAKTI